MKRRTAVKTFMLGTISFLLASVPYGISRMLAPSREFDRNHYRRPPGALKDAAAFSSACIGCGLCGEVCPPKCIRFSSREGGEKLNTPYIDPAQKACTLCGKCMEVCPTNALTVTDRHDVDMGIAQIDRSACYPWVDKGVCGACVVVCPLGESAIGFEFANIYRPIVREGCVGCGLCVEVCPHPSLPIWVVDRHMGTIARHKV